jgi:hypothetical protein
MKANNMMMCVLARLQDGEIIDSPEFSQARREAYRLAFGEADKESSQLPE